MQPNAIHFKTLMDGYVNQGNEQKAFQILQMMKQWHVNPDDSNCEYFLQKCTDKGNMQLAEQIVKVIIVSEVSSSCQYYHIMMNGYLKKKITWYALRW